MDKRFKDFDNIFFYGQGDLLDEIRVDIWSTLVQPRRSLFYSRSLDSAGIPDYENYPNGMTLKIMIPYAVVSALSRRNQFVSNGTGDTPDRRIALSQNTVTVEQSGGSVMLTVLYIPLAKFETTQKLEMPIGA